MDWTLMILIGIVGGVSTYGMIEVLRYFHDKERK